jgi:RHS repeat-associated protein
LYWYGIGTDPLVETDNTGSTTNAAFHEYIFFNGKRVARRDSSNVVNYYFADHLGTARVATSSAGTPCYDADFYPYGGERPISDTCDSGYKFVGKERDSESGLDNFGARFDSSVLGRFMSPDPGAFDLGNPQSLNRYVYGLDNPVVYFDLDGASSISPIYTIGRGIYTANTLSGAPSGDATAIIASLAGAKGTPLEFAEFSQSIIEGGSGRFSKFIPYSPTGGGGGCVGGVPCTDSFNTVKYSFDIRLSFSHDEKTGAITGVNIWAFIYAIGATSTTYWRNPLPGLTGPPNALSDVKIDPEALKNVSPSELKALERFLIGRSDPISLAIYFAVLEEQQRRAAEQKQKEKPKCAPKKTGISLETPAPDFSSQSNCEQ